MLGVYHVFMCLTVMLCVPFIEFRKQCLSAKCAAMTLQAPPTKIAEDTERGQRYENELAMINRGIADMQKML